MGFAVTRTSKSLVAPSSPTPAGETLRLSCLDRVPGLRHLVLSLHAFDGAKRVDAAFDVCVAKTWQSRTRALRLAGRLADDHPVHVCFFANTRHLMLAGAAEGFYGNCFYPVTVTCSSAEVAAGEVVDLVRTVRDAKARLAGDVARWAVGGFAQDPYELRFTYDSLFVSDWTRLGFLEADYGWGAPTHVVPFSYHPFMAVAVIGTPPAPKIGARVMTMCVEEAHLPEFRDQMNAFAAGK
ncbi:unnamed protein product [Triticum turgidum subsp. durum]|uniref:Uncharacterized protein n=1 Tax=Triticum turgidum subsp. durum TaxID=4567 RepID=A0A9R0PYL5_TRITD|nr:unnamed protein product [Triticum turgidum subsp. durum]